MMLNSPILGQSVSGSHTVTGSLIGNQKQVQDRINDTLNRAGFKTGETGYKETDATKREDALRQQDRETYLKDRAHQEAREDALRREAQERDDTAHTRLFRELESLGLNPHAIFGSASAGASRSVSGGGSSSSPQSPRGYSYGEDDGVDLRSLLLLGTFALRLLRFF